MKRHGKSLPERISAAATDHGAVTAAVIGSGGIAAIPTETSYGLAVDPFNPDALQRLFDVKQRPTSKPVLVLIDTLSALKRLSPHIPDIYQPIINQFWPGPLTLIVQAHERIPALLTAGTGTVGVRMSSNRVATGICRCAGGCITATSANVSGCQAACSAEEVIENFEDLIDIVVDGGALNKGPASSIIGYEQGSLVSIRDGVVPFAAIRESAAKANYRVN